MVPWVLRVRQSLAVDWAPEQVRSRARPARAVPQVMERVTDDSRGPLFGGLAKGSLIPSSLRTDFQNIPDPVIFGPRRSIRAGPFPLTRAAIAWRYRRISVDVDVQARAIDARQLDGDA